MAANPPFVVRQLPSSGLEGAFRVHLPPDGLDKLNLNVGDLCQISSDNDPSKSGYAIAWRATDKMGNSPKLRPAKMTDTLRTAYGLKEGSHVSIVKTAAKIKQAKKIILGDVTPSDYGTAPDNEVQDWGFRCHCLLFNCEAIAAGLTFDVTAKKGLRKRFIVDHVEADGIPAGGPGLYSVRGRTEVLISDGSVTSKAEETSLLDGVRRPVFDSARIGGLVEQAKELNMRLDLLLDKPNKVTAASQDFPWNQHILIHGYEGTGKTSLLNSLENARACKAVRLSKATLAGGTPSKNIAVIQSTFHDALAEQPSLVLIDDVDKLAPADDEIYAPTLSAEFDKLIGSQVLVIGTARSAMTGVSPSLLDPDRFDELIELPIPDVAARREILGAIGGVSISPSLASAIAERTHAFTGKDLARLVRVARMNVFRRHGHEDSSSKEWVDVHRVLNGENGGAEDGDLLTLDTPANTQTTGSAHSSQATTQVGSAVESTSEAATTAPTDPLPISADDFELALTKIKPTALREVFLEKPKVRWSDIGGSGAMKQRFDETIGWPLKHPEIDEELGIDPQKGVLLYGPPGCSKTLTAQAVATTYDLNFIAVKGAELISMYVGESERAVREVFRKAKQAAPCIIFFDEIDSIGAERDGGATKGLNVLTTLLTEMDGFEGMKGVLVLAATNKPEVLDPALLRPGRFDEHVYVGLPTEEARRDIIAICLRNRPVSDNLDYDGLARATDGYSGAEIVGICNAAKRRVRREKLHGDATTTIGQEDFEEAIRQTAKGITEEMLEGYEKFERRGFQ